MRPGSHSHNQDFFFVGGCFGENFPERVADKGMTPEFQAVLRSALEADAIHCRHRNTVGNGMGTLHGAPGVQLRRAELLLVEDATRIAVG